MPKIILHNAKVLSQDPEYPQATSVAIRANRFQAVGSDEEILSLAKANTQVIDAEGHVLLPGFADSHMHLYDFALGLRRLNLTETKSLEDLKERLRQKAAHLAPTEWLLGQGWNETRWSHPTLPTAQALDEAAPDHCVILWRSDMHLAVVNSKALNRAGITSQTDDPPGGHIDRTSSGHPTGVLRELAINLVKDIIPPPSQSDLLKALKEAFPLLHRLGLTGIHDFRNMTGEEALLVFHAYQTLNATKELPLRLWMTLPAALQREAMLLGLRTGYGTENLQIGHVKLFSDGSQGARTAWMLEPYQDKETFGMPLVPMEEIAERLRQANQAGISLAVHAIGDRAIRELISLFEKAQECTHSLSSIPPKPPHRIEHVQNIRPADLRRLSRLGIIASVQPLHITDDIPMIEETVGPRARNAYPFQAMVDAGVHLAFGSDCPVADPNPFWGIHAATTRQRRDGTPAGGWYPDQCISMPEALRAYTLGPAEACGRLHELGSITPGKFADLILLDRDILAVEPEEIAHTKVLLTIADGKVVYAR